MKTALNTALIFSIATIVTGSIIFGKSVSIQQQITILSSLREIAAIIFGVMGAWVAIIYPKALKNIYDLKSNPDEILQGTYRLFKPIRWSTVIVAISLIYIWIYPILIQLRFLVDHTHIIRPLSFALIGFLVLAQIYTLVLSLIPLEDSAADINAIARSRKSQTARHSQQQKATDDNKNL